MTNLDGVGRRRPIHTWGEDDRTLAAVLCTVYNITGTAQQKIFNHVYKNTLLNEGYEDGEFSGLPSQLSDMKRGKTGYEHFQKVIQMPLGEAMITLQSFRQRIEHAARALNIDLYCGALMRAPVATPALHPSTPKRTREEDDDDIARLGSEDGNKDDTHTLVAKKQRYSFVSLEVPDTKRSSPIRTPTKSRPQAGQSHQDSIERILNRVRPIPKLRITDDFEGFQTRHGRPRLLYRAVEPAHGFKARRFLNPGAHIPTPPAFGTNAFRQEVQRHLEIDQSYLSPVISLTESARYALKIVRDAQPIRSFAIFDIYDIEEDSTERFGDRCRPWLVTAICKKHNLVDLPNGYTGVKEWLTWGNMQCSPIAVFAKDTAIELQEAIQSMDSLSEENGKKMGKLLHMIDDDRKDVVARSLVKAFKVPGHDVDPERSGWEVFGDALHAASEEDRPKSIVSTLREISIEEPVATRAEERWSEFTGTVRFMTEEDMVDSKAALRAYALDLLKDAQGQKSPSEEKDQGLVNAQIAAESEDHGIIVDRSSQSSSRATSGIPKMKTEDPESWVNIRTPSPTSPARSSSATDSAREIPTSSTSPSLITILNNPVDDNPNIEDDLDMADSQVIDPDSDIEVELEITDVREVTGTPIDEDTDEEFVIIGTSCRGRHALPIRSKSESLLFIGTREIQKKKKKKPVRKA